MHALAPAALRLAAALPGGAQSLLGHLTFAVLQGALFMLAAWVICRLAPRLPAGLRCTLWWLASLKLVAGLLWPAPLALPLLPAALATRAGIWAGAPVSAAQAVSRSPHHGGGNSDGSDSGSHSPRGDRGVLSGDAATVPFPAQLAAARSAGAGDALPDGAPGLSVIRTASFQGHLVRSSRLAGAASAPGAHPASRLLRAARRSLLRWWAPALAAAWLLGVALQLAALAREWWQLRRLLARTRPVEDAALLALATGICRRLGLPPTELRLAPALAPPHPSRPAQARERLLPAPFTARTWRPVVVLPASGLAGLSPEEATMTLCHELMHVRRRDLLWGWMPAIAARLFFFLPLAAWVAREYALAREAACDSAVVRLLGAAPVDYGRLLLRLAVAPPARRGAALVERWPAPTTVASAASSLLQLKRRLEMLQQPHDLRPRRTRRLGFAALGLLAAVALVPLRPVSAAPGAAPATAAASTSPALSAGLSAGVPTGPAVTATGPGAASPDCPVPAAREGATMAAGAANAGILVAVPSGAPANPSGAARAVLVDASKAPCAEDLIADLSLRALPAAQYTRAALAPAERRMSDLEASAARADSADHEMDAAQPYPPDPPDAPPAAAPASPPPAPPAPPALPAPPAGRAAHSHSSYSYRYSSDDNGEAYILFQGAGDTVRMSGDTDDIPRARELRRKAGGGDLLWLRHGGREYLVSDPATLRQVREIFRPSEELGAKQGELGDRQGKLGDQQAALGERQGDLGESRGRLGEEQARLAEDEARLETREASSNGGRLSADDEKRRDDLHARMERNSAAMRKLGDEARALGEQERRLGEQQRELGRQQRELGRQQRLASQEADRQFKALIDRAVASGAARPVQ